LNTIGLWGFDARPCALDVFDNQIQLKNHIGRIFDWNVN
jgi:hypothetical protein